MGGRNTAEKDSMSETAGGQRYTAGHSNRTDSGTGYAADRQADLKSFQPADGSHPGGEQMRSGS